MPRAKFYLSNRAQLELDTRFYERHFANGRTLLVLQSPDCIKLPQTIWDALKERYFPQWWLRRWPVAYTCLYAKAYLPELGMLPSRHHGNSILFWHEDLPKL